MTPSRRVRLSLSSLLVVATAVSCDAVPKEPVIGFTYNWGEPGLVEFLEAEIARRAPEGAPHIRVRAGPTENWRSLGSTSLAAEVNRALALAEDPNVVVVVGPGGSREVLQVAPVYRRAQLAHLAPTATSRALANSGEWTFLLAPNDSLQGEFIGAFADTALGARTAAIFYAPDEYGIGLAAGTEATLAARGVRLLDRVPVRGSADCLEARGMAAYDGLAAQLAQRGTPDVIVVASRAIESACLLRSMRARWPPVRLIAGDGAYVDEAFFRRAGDKADDSYFVAFWHPSPADTASMTFARGFAEATGRAPRHGDAIFFDAVMLAAAAVHEVGPNRRLVRDYLATVGDRRPAFHGIAGPVGFTATTRRALLMTHILGGAVRVVGVH